MHLYANVFLFLHKLILYSTALCLNTKGKRTYRCLKLVLFRIYPIFLFHIYLCLNRQGWKMEHSQRNERDKQIETRTRQSRPGSRNNGLRERVASRQTLPVWGVCVCVCVEERQGSRILRRDRRWWRAWWGLHPASKQWVEGNRLSQERTGMNKVCMQRGNEGRKEQVPTGQWQKGIIAAMQWGLVCCRCSWLCYILVAAFTTLNRCMMFLIWIW